MKKNPVSIIFKKLYCNNKMWCGLPFGGNANRLTILNGRKAWDVWDVILDADMLINLMVEAS